MDYQILDIKAVKGRPTFQLVEEGVTPPMPTIDERIDWIQTRIVRLRQVHELHQVAIYSTAVGHQAAIIAIESADFHGNAPVIPLFFGRQGL